MITSHHKENEAQPGSRLLLDTTSENTPLYQYTRACKKKKSVIFKWSPQREKVLVQAQPMVQVASLLGTMTCKAPKYQ